VNHSSLFTTASTSAIDTTIYKRDCEIPVLRPNSIPKVDIMTSRNPKEAVNATAVVSSVYNCVRALGVKLKHPI
jgi:hypothetical protein